MSHASKSKAKGINASSFFDLKAELSKQEVEFAKAKAAGSSSAVVGGVKRPDRKPTVWARQNKGVKSRATKDVELEEVSKQTVDSARAALERKAKIYEKLRKGKTGGLNDTQYDALLVDFDSNTSSSKYYEGHSSDEDESLKVPTKVINDDPIVEYEDEFGRIRTARRSEVPRNLVLNHDEGVEVDEDEDIVIHNPVNHFPTYQPSEERMAEIAKKYAEENNPLAAHYNASKEVRAKGAGFYQFSADEETRKAQMEELKASREETSRIRQELGAEDIKYGDVEGMRDGEALGSISGTIKSRAMEKRKREIEERRRLLEAKRRKMNTSELAPVPVTNTKDTSTYIGAASTGMEPSISSGSTTNKVENKTKPIPLDPFATLEAHTTPPSRTKRKGKNASPTVEVDTFLASLEQEFLSARKKA